MTLYKLINLICDDTLPLHYDSNGFDCYERTSLYIKIIFHDGDDDMNLKTVLHAPILIPWYDCKVKAIDAEDSTIIVYLDEIEFVETMGFTHHLIKEKEN